MVFGEAMAEAREELEELKGQIWEAIQHAREVQEHDKALEKQKMLEEQKRKQAELRKQWQQESELAKKILLEKWLEYLNVQKGITVGFVGAARKGASVEKNGGRYCVPLKGCKQMRTWLKNTRDRKAENLQYLAVPELHKDMESWHFHVLLANTGDLEFSESGIVQKEKKVFNMPGWTLGFSTATKVQDTYRVQKYITKYMTKECHVMSKGDHRYFVSQNLPKPKKSIFVVGKGEEMNMIHELADRLQSEVVWIWHSRPGSYVDVTYVELQPDLRGEGNEGK